MRFAPRTVTYAAFGLLLAHSSSPAQLLHINDGRFYFLAGNAMTNMERFNERLAPVLDFRIDQDFNTIGGGFYLNLIDNWTLGGEIHLMLSRTEPMDVYNGKFSGRFGYVNLGYLYHSGEGLNIFPEVGLGSSVLNIDIRPLGGGGFPGGSSGLNNQIGLSTVGFNVKFGVNADYLLAVKTDAEGKTWGIVLGFDIAYQFTPAQSEWERSGIRLFDDPNFKLQGAFLKLAAGFGWKED